MAEDTKTTWQEALRVTAVIMGWMIGFWLFFFGIVFIYEHFYEIKMFFGLGGQIV